MTGGLSVLNVGAGDIALSFNHMDEREAQEAVRMLKDMRDRGYAILVRDADGAYQRAVDIDATQGRYIIALPAAAETPADAVPVTCECGCGTKVKPGNRFLHGHSARKRGKRRVGVPIEKRKATGVARSAGG